MPVRLDHVIARSLLTDSCVVTVGILVGLFMLHRKQGRIEREKRLQYWRDQVHLACLPAVFVRALRDVGEVSVDGTDRRFEVRRGDVWVVRWSAVKNWVEIGDLELI